MKSEDELTQDVRRYVMNMHIASYSRTRFLQDKFFLFMFSLISPMTQFANQFYEVILINGDILACVLHACMHVHRFPYIMNRQQRTQALLLFIETNKVQVQKPMIIID